MKNIKKLVAIILVIALTLSIFSGCSVKYVKEFDVNVNETQQFHDLNVHKNDLSILPLSVKRCSFCSGSGREVYYYTCYSCRGSGDTTTIVDCRTCGGAGSVYYGPCRNCPDCMDGSLCPNRYINCSSCSGTGDTTTIVNCSNCSGSGSDYDYRTCSNCSGKGTITTPEVIVSASPIIPNSLVVGENKLVSVSANLIDGAGTITYQWYNNNVAITGATSATYNLSTLAVGTHKLKCKLSAPNAVDVYTTESTVTVLPKPNITITSQPQSKNIVFGDNETISVTVTLANGLGELKYQWYDGETAINGATSSTLNLSTLSVGTHKLKCKISSVSADDIISNISTVVVANVPVITINTQPTAKELFAGDNVSINIGATVANQITAPTYQWYDNNVAINGATSSTLNLSTLSVGTHQIKCVVSSVKAVAVTSNVVAITVKAKPTLTITQQPTNKEFYFGETENLSIIATIANSQGAVIYQWFDGTTEINGETSATLNLSTMTVGTHQIKVVISSANAVSITSNIVTVTVNKRPTIVITKQPEDKTIVVGDNATIGVIAEVPEDNASLSYQWKRDDEPIANATNNILSLHDLPSGMYNFNCKLSSGDEVIFSDVATVIVASKSTPTPKPTVSPTPTESPTPTATPTGQPTPPNGNQSEPTVFVKIVNFCQLLIDLIVNIFKK